VEQMPWAIVEKVNLQRYVVEMSNRCCIDNVICIFVTLIGFFHSKDTGKGGTTSAAKTRKVE